MADQEITVADALAYAATRRVFKDTNSRVLVVLADALEAAEAALAAAREITNGDKQ